MKTRIMATKLRGRKCKAENDNSGKKWLSSFIAASIPIVVGLLALLGSLYVNYKNEVNKREFELYTRKEQKYASLIRNMSGFNRSVDNIELRVQFINDANQCLMYCSDEVVNNVNKFLYAVSDMASESEKSRREDYAKAIVLSIRRDLSQYKYGSSDSHLAANDIDMIFRAKASNTPVQ